MAQTGHAISAAATRTGAATPAVFFADATITFRLADGGSYTAIERISLRVADGEFVSIVGPTGCGKTTLLNIAAGLLAPTSEIGRAHV